MTQDQIPSLLMLMKVILFSILSEISQEVGLNFLSVLEIHSFF
ncbi:rCG56592, isoform CRA_a [Rattus norvegicus]|uniref:RCG56592, isoform CRA_a n=1 Tax=Rattus norvegicus TaxID=10116 RepID=A6KEN6_RAT|nr:rCG56592, isoform CRA_a [Rattus norvegicus]